MKSFPLVLQKHLAARTLAEIPYVVLRPLTDHTAGTLEDRELFGTFPLAFVYSSEIQAEAPFLRQVTPPTYTMSHLPTPQDSGIGTFVTRMRATLVNPPYGDYASLYDYLTRNVDLDNAQIELRSFVLSPDDLAAPFVDGANTPGGTLDLFSGIVDRVVAVGPEIQLECRSESPTWEVRQVPDLGSDPRDRGAFLPSPLGLHAAVRCVNLEVGAVSAITVELTIDGTNLALDDATSFPASGSAMIAAEKISWTSKQGNQLLGLTRGESGTFAAEHVTGTAVFEIQPITLGVADYPIGGVRGLYILSETTGTTILIPELLYSFDNDDETTSPGEAGAPISTIKISATQLSSILNAVYAKATVIQQAEYTSETPPTQGTNVTVADHTQNQLFTELTGATGDWFNVQGNWTGPTPPSWVYNRLGSLQQKLRAVFGSLLPDSLYALVSIRWRLTIVVNTINTPITFGLTGHGIEGFLVGAVEGEIVLSYEVFEVGTFVVEGTLYQGVQGTNLGDLDSMYVEIIKSDVAGGNRSIDVEFTDLSAEVTWNDDTTVVTQEYTPDTDAITGTSSQPSHTGTWIQAPPVRPPIFRYRITDPLAQPVRSTFTTNPVPPGEFRIEAARFRFTSTWTDVEGTQVGPCIAYCRFGPEWVSNGFVTSQPATISNDHGNTSGTITNTRVLNLVADPNPDDLIGCWVDMITSNVGGTSFDSDTYSMDEFVLELDVRVDGNFQLTPRVVDAVIQTASGGVGIEFFTIVDGPEIPTGQSASYPSTAADGDVITHPADLIYYWLTEVGGIASGDIDAATLTNVYNALPGYQMGFDARNMGASWREVLLRIGYESRTNVTRTDAGTWKAFAASPDTPTPGVWGFGSEVATIDQVADLIVIGKDDAERRSRLTVYYDFDPRRELGDSRSFFAVQTTDPTDPAVIAREQSFGRSDAEPYFLFGFGVPENAGDNDAAVADWRGYMEQELGRFARLLSCRVDHSQAAALDLGDVVKVVVGQESISCRVIEITRDARRGYLCRFAEVL